MLPDSILCSPSAQVGQFEAIDRWSKDFLEAGKKRLASDTAREATSDEVKGLRAESHQLKELSAELMMENRLLKKKPAER